MICKCFAPSITSKRPKFAKKSMMIKKYLKTYNFQFKSGQDM